MHSPPEVRVSVKNQDELGPEVNISSCQIASKTNNIRVSLPERRAAKHEDNETVTPSVRWASAQRPYKGASGGRPEQWDYDT